MPITAAEVESNGWVLRVTMTGSPTVPNTNFGTYALDPNGLARVALSSSHTGFLKSAGIAAATNLARLLVATKPLRKPVAPASPTAKVLDETDLGGGSIRVRLALSEHVYATDTGLSLAVLAGWRTGESAQSGISVTNNSTTVAPIPIMRWALAPYETTTGSFRVSLLVFSHHPVGFEPVAGVKFTATDGTTVKTVWATELGTDNTYGDNLRCYTAIIDPASGTALTAGLLRVDAEVHPWLGSIRTTDVPGTKLMTNLRTAGFSVDAQSPWVIGYDPAGTRYGQMWAYVDPVNGTATASAAMVATTLAGAKAVAPASRPISINAALQAGYLANRTLAAANGQASQARAADGLTIVLGAGTHVGCGTTAVTTGFTTAEIPARVIGDPDDSNPRTNCIVQTATSSVQRINRIRWQGLTIEMGTNILSAQSYLFVDNCTMRGKSGQESNTVGPFSIGPAAGFWNLAGTRSRIWRYGANFGSGNPKVGLFRANEHSRPVGNNLVAVKNRLIGNVEDGFTPASALPTLFSGWPSATLAGQVEDCIVAYNDVRYLRGRAWGPVTLPAASAGTPNPSIRRQVFFGNICERIGTDPQPFYSLGEDASATMTYNIIEANTFAGERANTLYSDPLPATLAETSTQLNQAHVNRVANNAFDWLPTKHDDFYDSSTATLRGTSDGYRPQMVDAWSALFGVGFKGNYDTARVAGSSFEFMWPGLRSVQNPYGSSVSPAYTNESSVAGPGGAGAPGGGNYLPTNSSPLIGRVLDGNSDRDVSNTPRVTNGAAGAYEMQGLALAPAGARSAHITTASLIGLVLNLPPTSSRHLHFADATTCGWSAVISPATAASGSRASSAPVSSALSGELLRPTDTRHQLPAGSLVILPDSGGTGVATLSIAADLRTLSIR